MLLLLRDATGSPGRLSAHIADSTSIGTARAAAAALAAAVSAVTGCALTGYSVVYETVGSDERAGPSDRRNVLRLVFEAGAGQYAAIDLPGLLPELVDEDGTTVDPSQPVIAAIVAELSSGIWVNPFGDDIGALLASYQEVQA